MQYLLIYSYTQPFGTHIALSSHGWFGSGNTQPLDSDFHDVGANLLATKNENYQHVLLMLRCSGLEFKELISCGKRNPKLRIGTFSSRYQGFVYTFWYGKRFFDPCLLALVEGVLRIAYDIHHWLGKLWLCFSFCCLFQFQFLEWSVTIQGACNSDCQCHTGTHSIVCNLNWSKGPLVVLRLCQCAQQLPTAYMPRPELSFLITVKRNATKGAMLMTVRQISLIKSAISCSNSNLTNQFLWSETTAQKLLYNETS